MDKKRLAIYARVSTEGQADEGFSIDAQISTLRSINESLGHTIVKEYIDSGISGKSMNNRPALLQMLDDAKAGLFDEIVVWKTNRLSRNHLDLLKIYEILEKYEVSFRSVTEPFDTGNPTGKLLFNLLASIGEFERETIVENVKNGMRQRAEQGLFNGGRILGYRSQICEDSRAKSKLVIIPKEAEIVRLIFQLYIKGKGYKYIANRLNDLGYKTIRGNNFGIQSVKKIINNPVYIGKIRFNQYVNYSKKRRKGNDNELILTDGKHDPIIDVETWERAQQILEKKSKRAQKVIKGIFLLTGIIRCPECGSPMVAGRVSKKDKNGNKKRWTYYQCSRYKNYGRNECRANSVRADYAEKYVLEYLSKFAFNDKLIEEVVNGINRKVDDIVLPIRKRIDDIENEKRDLDNRRRKVLSLYEEGIIDKKVLKERLDEIQFKINEYNEIQLNLNNQIKDNMMTTKIPIERVKKLLKNFGNILNISTREQKKLLLNLIVERITVTNDKQINKIELKFDQSIQKKLLLKEDSSNDEESSNFMPFSITI